VLGLTLLAILVFGEGNSSEYRKFIYLPDSFMNILQNISLLYFDVFPGKISPRLSPPTWALTIEIFFYALIALGVSRSKKITTLWFCTSLAYMVFTHVWELGYGYRYSIVLAGTLPFSTGAMIFHYYNSSWLGAIKSYGSPAILVLLLLFIINSGIAAIASKLGLPSHIKSMSFYANYLINSLVIIILGGASFPFISSKLDGGIGVYSYPVYLTHWQAGFVASMVIYGVPLRGFNPEGIVSFILALLSCFVVSYLIIRIIDTPIENYRKKVREKANKQLNSDAKAAASAPVS